MLLLTYFFLTYLTMLEINKVEYNIYESKQLISGLKEKHVIP